MNKTQQAVLRYVFGFDDSGSDRGVGVRCKPQSMPVVTGTREHKVALELVALGIAILRPMGPKFPTAFYLERAMQ